MIIGYPAILLDSTDSQKRLKWHILILAALSTTLRRGELLNCTWGDVDFEEQTIKVSRKEDADETWEWRIKDTDRRILPMTDELTRFPVDQHSKRPEGYPYVFVPPTRYGYIQKEFHAKGEWTYSDSRLKVVHNFGRDFNKIRSRANVETGTLHDFRRTAICHWFRIGLSEYDVMNLAGHADFNTIHRFHLCVQDDLIHRARQATESGLCKKSVTKVLQWPCGC